MEVILMNTVMEIYVVIEWKKMWSVFKFGDFVCCLLIVFFCVSIVICACVVGFCCICLLDSFVVAYQCVKRIEKKRFWQLLLNCSLLVGPVFFLLFATLVWLPVQLRTQKRFRKLWFLCGLFVLFASTDLQTTVVFGKLGWVPLKINSS